MIELSEKRKKQMKNDREYLDLILKETSDRVGVLSSNLWYLTPDSVITVANILDGEGCFKDTREVILFFEKPWKWESDIRDLVKEFAEELGEKTEEERR